jgi:hypothetical protein
MWLERPANQTSQFQEIDEKPEMYQILSGIIQKISQQFPARSIIRCSESQKSIWQSFLNVIKIKQPMLFP